MDRILRKNINKPATNIPPEYYAIQDTFYPKLSYLNSNYAASLSTYICMIQFALHAHCQRILEIGAGLSTIIFAKYAQVSGAEIYSIDLDFDPMFSYANLEETQKLVRSHVNLIQGVSIDPQSLLSFYSNPTKMLAGVDVRRLESRLSDFQKPFQDKRSKIIRKLFGNHWKISNLFVSGSGELHFPKELVDLYATGGSIENEVISLSISRKGKITSTLDRVLSKFSEWDLIFFDSGELTSLIELLQLEKHISIGGLAIFHDIFFPKSIKNMIASAWISSNDDWRVLFREERTPQGLLIAQKIK
jgi:predicted O-methyltransferase YrrM